MVGYAFMKLHKIAFIFSALAASLLLGACSSTNDGTVADKGFNCLGIVSYEPASFAPAEQSSAVIRTKELFVPGLPTGDRTSLLWGAIVIEDY